MATAFHLAVLTFFLNPCFLKVFLPGLQASCSPICFPSLCSVLFAEVGLICLLIAPQALLSVHILYCSTLFPLGFIHYWGCNYHLDISDPLDFIFSWTCQIAPHRCPTIIDIPFLDLELISIPLKDFLTLCLHILVMATKWLSWARNLEAITDFPLHHLCPLLIHHQICWFYLLNISGICHLFLNAALWNKLISSHAWTTTTGS